MRPYCEIIVQTVLPTLRSIIAKELVEKYGLSQTIAAKRLGTTRAAVTQYLSLKRGKAMNEITGMSWVKSYVDRIAKEISNDSKNSNSLPEVMTILCELCKLMRKEDLICDLHKDITLSQDCDVCGNII